jgi:tetratricopeptide (TPR) repeat protein
MAFSNLNSQINGIETGLAADPKSVSRRLMLAERIAVRGHYTARIADYERAAQITDELVRDAPGKGEVYLARASARATLHRFTEALADLDEADRLSPGLAGARAERAAILQARGKLEEALALRRAEREAHKTMLSLGNEAALLGEMGKLDEAALLFREAASRYRDVSPLPVAWLFFQEGVMWERAGQRERAKAFFAAAHDRLPVYAHAASHLAQLEAPARALELLAPLLQSSDDPEFELLLARRLQDSGRQAEAEPHLARVRARYDELVKQHPAAFADHAGWFWLDEGKDPKKALALAKQNLEVRKTSKAYELALLASIAAGSREDGCALADEATKLPNGSEMLRRVASNACPR